ncbi:MAG TPA: hypothetical protein VMG59_12110 [Phycisphaerae bacterium]|nr:hypothetical protein [Phycisphaerae bacterium]
MSGLLHKYRCRMAVFVLLFAVLTAGMLSGCSDNLFADPNAPQAEDKALYFPDPQPIEQSNQGEFNDSGFVAPPVNSGTGIGGY